MKIILSPAKKMKVDTDSIDTMSSPVFLEKTEEILGWMQGRTEEELKKLWKCNDKITTENIERIKTMNFQKQLTPAVLAYEGIAYQYMAPAVFEDGHFDYVQEHLRILSAFYGVLKPMDGITPYKLGQKKAGIALGITGLVIGTTVFFEAGVVVLIPLAFSVAKQTKKSTLYYAIPLLAGLASGYAFVPPSAGSVLVADSLGVNLGVMIMVGIPTALICMIVAGVIWGRFIGMELKYRL